MDARIPVVIVELDLDTCSLEYGVSPCTASVPDGRNNYLYPSENFTTGLWLSGGFTILNNNVLAPDGTTTGARATATSTFPNLYYDGVGSPYGSPVRLFIWVKKGTRSLLTMQVFNITTASYVFLSDVTWNFDTLQGVNCSVVDTAVGGWYRLEIRINSGVAPGDSLRWLVEVTATWAVGEYTYLWGAQVSYPAFTSDFRYVKTTAFPVIVNPAITGTGTSECFNTFSTCQDKVNYARATKTYRFANQRLDGLQLAGEAPTFPVVMGVDLAPTEITPRAGLGVRASCTVQLKDFVYNDEGVDPYIATRRTGADWENKSTFARRFLARNANYENRAMRIISGFRDESGVLDLSSFTTRSYLLQAASWPDAQGNWSVMGKDPLRLADSDRAVWPPRANTKVNDAVDALATLLICSDPDNRLAADLADDQPYIRVGEEFMLMTDVAWSLGTAAVTVTRATIPSYYPGPQFNIAAEISAGSAVTPCRNYDSVSLPDVIFELLNECAGIDASFLPLAEWNTAMSDAGRSSLRLSALIPEPTAAKDLITEVTQLNVNIWWDERESLVKLQSVLVNPPITATWTDREHLLENSIEIAASSRTRISQSWIYHAHQWPLAQMDKLQSFYGIQNFSDLGAEADEFFGTVALQETRTRWLPLSQGSDVVAMALNIVLRYRYGKVGVTMSVDPKDRAAWSGDTVVMVSSMVVDALGQPTPVSMSILMAEEQWTEMGVSYRYTGEGQVTGILASQTRLGVIAPDSLPDYSSQTVEQRNHYASIAPDSGQFPDGKPAFTLAG